MYWAAYITHVLIAFYFADSSARYSLHDMQERLRLGEFVHV